MPYPVDNKIAGRLCLITGASGGVGRAVAKCLYMQGVSLGLTYLNNEEGIEDLVRELDGLWLAEHPPKITDIDPDEMPEEGLPPAIPAPKISIHQTDVSSPKDLSRTLTELSEYHDKKGADMVVSCASYHPPDRPKILEELDSVIRTAEEEPVVDPETLSTSETEAGGIDEWKETFGVNLRSNFILARLVLPYMMGQKWGRIVFITGGEHESIHYQASKAGLAGFMRHLSNRVIGEGVTVNSVSPVFIKETGMLPRDLTETQIAEFERQIPAGRLGAPEEVANVVNMFLSTGFMTGQSVVLAGGIKYVG